MKIRTLRISLGIDCLITALHEKEFSSDEFITSAYTTNPYKNDTHVFRLLPLPCDL